MTATHQIHPDWFNALSRAYDARTHVIAREAAALRRIKGAAANKDLVGMLKQEYGTMPNADFDSRVGIARGIDSLIRRWGHSGRTVIDVNDESLAERSHRLKARGTPVFLSLTSCQLYLFGDQAVLIDGAYVERVAAGSATTVTFVTRRPSLAIDGTRLGGLLQAQSTVGVGVVAEPEATPDVNVLMCDERLARDAAFDVARRLVNGFLFRLYATEPSQVSSVRRGPGARH